jgi:DNA-binding response OmpR family regulator
VQAAATPPGSRHPGSSPNRSLRIVLADDNFDTLATLKAILRDEGHEVLGVGNGRSALEAVRHFDPDVVILDIAMPDLSGWEVAREIRTASGQSDRPLLIATSGRYKQASDKMLGEIAGFHHYLVKPYESSALLALLAQWASQ